MHPTAIGTTISHFLIEEQKSYPQATGDFTSVVNDVVIACKTISSAMRYGALAEGDLLGVSETTNVQGEVQKTLDILANKIVLRRAQSGGHVAAMVSEEMESIYQLSEDSPEGHYLLLYDPVDGSSNIAENAAIGTIFSILKRPEGASGHPTEAEFLQPGIKQVCAGYAIYGPSTMIVITTGNGVNGFTLDPLIGEFILSHPTIRIPVQSPRVFVNALDARHWDVNLQRFLEDRMQDKHDSASPVDFRWSAGAVAEIHRIMIAGGVYLSPGNKRLSAQGIAGNLRLLYEINPLAFLVEQAGGSAVAGKQRALEIEPTSLHQRFPAYFGSKREIERLQKILQIAL